MMEFSGVIRGAGRLRGNRDLGMPMHFEILSLDNERDCEELPFTTKVRLWNTSGVCYDGKIHGPDQLSSFRVAMEFVIATVQF
jgi:hypothetical protein